MRRQAIVAATGLAIGVLAVACITTGRGQTDDSVRGVMAQKLTHAQQALEGIANDDLNKTRLNAAALIALTHQAEWRPLEKPEYLIYSAEFRDAAESLQRHATEKNIDAAALDYVRLTLSCVNCHKHIRDARRAGIELPETFRVAALALVDRRNAEGGKP
ncbi:MAG: hypothetical protein GC159_18655 [Phycisphaera sp.]|nr:hypothetical protein [Phycisphaera sp.]